MCAIARSHGQVGSAIAGLRDRRYVGYTHLPSLRITPNQMTTTFGKNKQALTGCGACAGVFILFLFLIATLGNTPELTPTDQVQTPQPSEEENLEGLTAQEVTVVFDLETLYGKNIDEVREVLGTPTDADPEPSDLQIEWGTTEWWNSFKKDGYELTVTFDVPTRKVKDFFLSANDPSGPDGLTKNTELLEKLLNVKDSPNFTIEPVQALKDPSYYTGIIASPIQ